MGDQPNHAGQRKKLFGAQVPGVMQTHYNSVDA
jgi:hypothetical protein